MGILIEPQHQLRFAFYLIGGGVTALMLICLYLLISLEKTIGDILTRGQVETVVSDALLDHVGKAELNVTVVSLILMSLAVAIGVKLSHRIYGPIVQIRKHVQKLREGDYSSRVQLRDHDHFVELADDLNDLAADLQTKS